MCFDPPVCVFKPAVTSSGICHSADWSMARIAKPQDTHSVTSFPATHVLPSLSCHEIFGSCAVPSCCMQRSKALGSTTISRGLKADAQQQWMWDADPLLVRLLCHRDLIENADKIVSISSSCSGILANVKNIQVCNAQEKWLCNGMVWCTSGSTLLSKFSTSATDAVGVFFAGVAIQYKLLCVADMCTSPLWVFCHARRCSILSLTNSCNDNPGLCCLVVDHRGFQHNLELFWPKPVLYKQRPQVLLMHKLGTCTTTRASLLTCLLLFLTHMLHLITELLSYLKLGIQGLSRLNLLAIIAFHTSRGIDTGLNALILTTGRILILGSQLHLCRLDAA